MNGRRFALMLGYVATAVACAASAATLPMDLRTTTNADAVKPTIQAFIDKQVTQMAGTVPTEQSTARDAIVAEVQPPVAVDDPPLSSVFLSVYADVLNSLLQPLEKNPDPRVRLNAAIAAERVAEKAGNDSLTPLVTDLLNDQSKAVQLWAIKACKYLLPPILSNAVTAQNNQLLPTFIKTVEQQGKSGPIIYAAYDALRVDQATVGPAAWGQVVPPIVTAIHSLLENRIAEYHGGIPVLPGADAVATTYLVDTQVWPTQNKDQQQRTVQDIADLMSVAAQRWDTASPSERLDLTEVLKKAGQAVWVVGQNTGAADLQRAEEQLKVTPSTPTADINSQLETLRNSIKSVPDFAGLKDAPSLEPIATSAPATTEPSSTP